MRARRYVDVSALPEYAFGSRHLMWWGAAAFMVIEGSMFAMLLATWSYLVGIEPTWPPAGFAPPALLWGTVNTAIFLASAWPNRRLLVAAEALDIGRTLRWLVVSDAVGVALLAVRALELGTLNVRWDSNAYGSIVWLVLGFHTVHLLTEVVETVVLTVMLARQPGPRHLVDVSDSCHYWDFVILVWLPLYVVIYLAPRWM